MTKERIEELRAICAKATRLHRSPEYHDIIIDPAVTRELLAENARLASQLGDAKRTMEKITQQVMSLHLTQSGLNEYVQGLAREFLERMKRE